MASGQEERLLDPYLGNKPETYRYESRIAEIERSRRTVQDELTRIQDGAAHLKRLGCDRAYETLDVTVLAHGDGNLEIGTHASFLKWRASTSW